MKIVKTVPELRRLIRGIKKRGKRIGFVPTMGAFHEGHLSLICTACHETDVVVVSIFVNPIQFNRRVDFTSYPRMLHCDARRAASVGADLLFVPSASAMYPLGFQSFVEVERLSTPWEGKFRPGHFRGVTTVIAKLLHLVQPDVTYCGQKDAQQARVIQQMIRDLNFDVVLRIIPTVREPDGLAMSSRNQHLSSEARRSSRILFAALQEGRRLIKWGERRGDVVARRMGEIIQQVPGARLDYVAVVEPKTLQKVKRIRGPVWALIAVWIGSVRLIDHATFRP